MAFRNPTPGFLLDNKYRLAERIGGGGMGDVFRAEHTVTSRSVAIKFLHPELVDNAELSQRFFQEAQAVNRIRHPNIVDVLDAGVSDLGPYIVMEHLDGESVGTALTRFGRFEPDAAVGTAIPVLEALDAAHRAGIIHRDLKPENVFIAFDASSRAAVVRLLDFGIAKVLDSDQAQPRTRTGVVFGTPDYLSPEQATGEVMIDGRSDLFAVGVLMYELLTGQRPFRAATAVATAFKVVHTEAPSLVSVGVTVDSRLEAAIQRLLQKDPSARYATAGDVVRDLERLADPSKRSAALGKIINVPRRLALLSAQGGVHDSDRHTHTHAKEAGFRSWGTPSPPNNMPIAASSTRPALRMSSPRLTDPVPPRSDSSKGVPRVIPPIDTNATRQNVGDFIAQVRGVEPPSLPRTQSSPRPSDPRPGDARPADARPMEVRGSDARSNETPPPKQIQIRALPSRFAGKYQVRGPVLRSVDKAITDAYGKAARDNLVAQMPAKYASDFRHDSINALVGYELEALDAYMEIASSMLVQDQHQWRNIGKQAVGGELFSVVRTLLRPSPDLLALIRRGVSTWSRLFTFGSWRVAKGPTGKVALQVGEFDPASLPLRLWVVGMIEETSSRAMGSDVKIAITLGELGFAPELALELG